MDSLTNKNNNGGNSSGDANLFISNLVSNNNTGREDGKILIGNENDDWENAVPYNNKVCENAIPIGEKIKVWMFQGDVSTKSDMTAHEMSKLKVKEDLKVAVLPKKKATFEFMDYAKNNYNKSSLSEMDPIPQKFAERRRHFFNATQFYRRKGFEGNILSEEGKKFQNEFKKHRYDDTNAERALVLYKQHYFPITLKATKYKTLGNKIKVERTFSSYKGREEAKLIVDVSVHTKEHRGLFTLPKSICKHCDDKQISVHSIKECDCVLICCLNCKWAHYTTETIWNILLGMTSSFQGLSPFNDVIKIDLKTLLFDIEEPDIDWSKFETNLDAYEEVINKCVNRKVELFCIHTRKELKKEYLLFCECGFLGDEHICNSAKNQAKINLRNMRNLGDVSFKKTSRIGSFYYTNEYLGIEKKIEGDNYICVTHCCEVHRGMELFRCSECRAAYNRVLNNKFEAYVIPSIVQQGDEGESDFIEFKEQGGMPSKIKSGVNSIIDKGAEYALDGVLRTMQKKWEQAFGSVPPISIFNTISNVLIKMHMDTSMLTPYKLLEYTTLLGNDFEVRKFIHSFLGEYIPESLFTFLFGRGTIIFRKKGLFEADPKASLLRLIEEGFYPSDDYKDLSLNELKWHEGYTYVKVNNCFKWKNYTFAAQGEMPAFIEMIVNTLKVPNGLDLLRRLQVINQGAAVFKTVSSFISFVVEFLPDIIKKYFFVSSELEWRQMCKENGLVDQLNTQLTLCSSSIANKKQISDAMFLPIEQNYSLLMNQVLKMGREKAKSFPQAKVMFDEISRIKKNIEEKYMPGEPRDMEPVWFEFVGTAGIGKSSMVKAMIATVDSTNLEEVQSTLYTRGPTKFYDGYRGQKTIVFDDFNASTVEGESDAQVVEVFLLVSNCEVPLDMASIAEKGTQMSAKRVITMGNKFVDISPAIKCGAALNRRKTLSVSISSVGEPNYDDFSHLRFQIMKVDGEGLSRFFKGTSCNEQCSSERHLYGVCKQHGVVESVVNFFQMCCIMKYKEQKKNAEHIRRNNAQKGKAFEKLLANIDFQGDGDSIEISSESFVNKIKGYYVRGISYVKDCCDPYMTLLQHALVICNLFACIVVYVGLPVALIRAYLNTEVTEEEFWEQSEGKTDRKNAKKITLQGETSYLEKNVTRIEFKGQMGNWLKSNCFIVGKTVLVNNHMLFFDEEDKLTIRILWRNEWKEMAVEKKDCKRLKNTAAACKQHTHDPTCYYCMNTYTDVTEIDLSRFPISPFKTKAHYFYSNKETVPKYLDEITFICKRKRGEEYVTVVSHGKGEVMTMRNLDGEERVFFIKTNIKTNNGDCGGVYTYKDRIIALHFGADTTLGHGLGQVVTKEEVGLFFEVNPDVKQQGETLGSHNLRNLIFEGLIDTASHRATKTEIKSSIIYEKFGSATTEPSVLSVYDPRSNGEDPIVQGVQKYNSDVKILDLDSSEYIQLCTNSFRYDKKGRCLSEQEAINGCDDFNLTGLDMSKSAGYGYQPSSEGKRNLFQLEDGVYKVKDLKLRSRLDELENSLKEGRVLLPISQITLKDERLKPGKATRTFNNFPVEYTIIARKYLGAFIGCAHSWYRDGKFYSIGINLYSNEAGRFITDLLRVSNVVFDGDYKNYDGVLPTVLIYFAYKAIMEWYNMYYDELKIVMLWFMHPTVVIEREVYTQITGNSSGNLMTTLINSIVGYELLYLAYTNLVPPMFRDQNEFNRNTSIKTFGDDNVCAVSRDMIEYFNHARVKDYFKNIGITYTRADKKDVDTDFIYEDDDVNKLRNGDIDTYKRYGMKVITATDADVEFLKNTFEFRNYKWCAKLRESVIIEMIYWIRSKEHNWTTNDSMSLEANINTSLRFAYFYGREYFEKWRKKLFMAVRDEDPNFSYSIVTYFDIHRQVEEYGFIPELDTWSRNLSYEEIRKNH